jgi:lysophospholipase L1-like esterase
MPARRFLPRRLFPLRHPVAFLPLTALVAMSIAACSRDDEPVPDRVLLFGDSLLWESADEVGASLAERGWDVGAIRAMPGATIQGPPLIDWPGVMEAEISDRRPGTVVIELGTNGCGNRCTSIDRAIDDTMEAARGVARVVWIGVRLDAPIPEDPRATNDALERATDRWPNLDYLTIEGAFDERHISGDDIHFTETGEARFADLIAEALGQPPNDEASR